MATLIEALLRIGVEVSVYTWDKTLLTYRRDLACASSGQLKYFIVPGRAGGTLPAGGHIGRIWDGCRLEVNNLKHAILRDGPSVVHAHWTYEFALAALDSGLPCLITCHDSPRDLLLIGKTPYLFGRYLMARRVFRRGKRFTAVSSALANALRDHIGTDVSVIANPVPEGPSRPRVAHRVAGEFRVVMVLNGWSRFKNPKPAIAAFAEFKRLCQFATLEVYGVDYGPDGKAHAWATRAGLTDGVAFIGPVPHHRLLRGIASASVLLHPSRLESFGMVVAEAMAHGVPVIGDKYCGGVPWLLADGACGFLVDARDTSAIASALSKVAAEPELSRHFADLAIRRIHAIAAPDLVAAKYFALYEEVIRDAAGRW